MAVLFKFITALCFLVNCPLLRNKTNQKEIIRKVMKVKFAQAAEVIGVTSRTLLNKVKSGKMSAEKQEGVYFVDVSELARTFGLSESQLNLLTGNKTKHKEIILERTRIEIELKYALEKIISLENQLEKSESREGKLLEIAGSTQKLLENSHEKRRKFFGVF
jgi:hypothetical protein